MPVPVAFVSRLFLTGASCQRAGCGCNLSQELRVVLCLKVVLKKCWLSGSYRHVLLRSPCVKRAVSSAVPCPSFRARPSVRPSHAPPRLLPATTEHTGSFLPDRSPLRWPFSLGSPSSWLKRPQSRAAVLPALLPSLSPFAGVRPALCSGALSSCSFSHLTVHSVSPTHLSHF